MGDAIYLNKKHVDSNMCRGNKFGNGTAKTSGTTNSRGKREDLLVNNQNNDIVSKLKKKQNSKTNYPENKKVNFEKYECNNINENVILINEDNSNRLNLRQIIEHDINHLKKYIDREYIEKDKKLRKSHNNIYVHEKCYTKSKSNLMKQKLQEKKKLTTVYHLEFNHFKSHRDVRKVTHTSSTINDHINTRNHNLEHSNRYNKKIEKKNVEPSTYEYKKMIEKNYVVPIKHKYQKRNEDNNVVPIKHEKNPPQIESNNVERISPKSKIFTYLNLILSRK
ncbi:hypothetical protein HEP_00222500 [Hepatocystis sp. ex Piliocolobus tephrosceles]|nr:hypothetical protein HEP_00222500 [Hepatocystis sp. ex Piliocolobus tephrosceles]